MPPQQLLLLWRGKQGGGRVGGGGGGGHNSLQNVQSAGSRVLDSLVCLSSKRKIRDKIKCPLSDWDRQDWRSIGGDYPSCNCVPKKTNKYWRCTILAL